MVQSASIITFSLVAVRRLSDVVTGGVATLYKVSEVRVKLYIVYTFITNM